MRWRLASALVRGGGLMRLAPGNDGRGSLPLHIASLRRPRERLRLELDRAPIAIRCAEARGWRTPSLPRLHALSRIGSIKELLALYV